MMGLKETLANIWSNVTLEPALFLFFVAAYMENTVISQLLIIKVCVGDMQQPRDICEHLEEDQYNDLEKRVQDEIAQFDVYRLIVESAFPMLLAFYLGAWCDLFGRKVLLYSYVILFLICQIFMVFNSYFIIWPKEYMLISYFLPTIVGSRAGFYSSIYAFIADVSSPKQRAVRMGCIQLVTNTANPVAAQLGKYVYNEFSFVGVFLTSSSLMTVSVIVLYLSIRHFKWVAAEGVNTNLRHMFAPSHVTNAIRTTFKKRPDKKHVYIWCSLFVMTVVLAPIIADGGIDYLYVQKRYQWGVAEFSDYRTVFSIVTIISQFILLQLVAKYDIRETTVLILCCCEALGGHLVKGLATEPWMFYLSVIVDLNGNYTMILARAIISQCVSLKELGQVMSTFLLAECVLPIVFSQLYATIWKATADTFVGAVRIMSAEAVMFALAAAVYMHWHLRGKRLRDLKDWEEDKLAKKKEEETKQNQLEIKEEETKQNQLEIKEGEAISTIKNQRQVDISTVL